MPARVPFWSSQKDSLLTLNFFTEIVLGKIETASSSPVKAIPKLATILERYGLLFPALRCGSSGEGNVVFPPQLPDTRDAR